MKQVTTEQLTAFAVKQVVIKAVRRFFDEKGFAEVIIPVANRAIPLEPTIYPFTTQWQAGGQPETFYLSASPEKTLKKYLAAGVEKCYGIGHCFRNLEGAGERHTPEFLMLEWYRTGARYQQIMQDVQDLVWAVKKAVDRSLGRAETEWLSYRGQEINLKQWQVRSVAELWAEKTGVSLKSVITEKELFTLAEKKGYQVQNATWEQVFNQIFLNEVEIDFDEQPFFLTEFPARISPLCQINGDKPYVADRFEFYIGGMEIGNGNNEGVSASLVREYFELEQNYRREQGLMVQPVDEEFLLSLDLLAQTKQKYAGIGLGLERLVMLMAGVTEIGVVGFQL